jgi:hypothetical protein
MQVDESSDVPEIDMSNRLSPDSTENNPHQPSTSSAQQQDISSPAYIGPERFHDLLSSFLTCGECRRILEDPVTLPCGNTLCRSCLPGSVDLDNCETLRAEKEPNRPAAPRSNCPYYWNQPSQGNQPDSSTEKWIPQTQRERFQCPFPECERKQHSRDVTSNYVLQKILSSVPSLRTPPVYSEKPQPPPYVSPAGVCDRIQSELDCQICYLLLHDPLTTPCGHTFCRPCLLRTSDHAIHPVCPTCRAPVLLPTPQNSPTNILIDTLIRSLFPDAAADRATSETSERHSKSSTGIDMPIFVCTLALPSVTCFLHIFEPRYRLMLRRCMAGDRRFGMVLPRTRIGTRYNEEMADMRFVQPADGAVPSQMNASRPHFMQYGTVLEIQEMQMLPDGRSLVETIGRERFKIDEWSVRDGYVVARTIALPDLDPTIYVPPSSMGGNLTTSVLANTAPESLSTNELIYLTRCFVQSLRNVPWLSARLRDNELEDQLSRVDQRGDAVKFAWWVGSKMPMEEGEAYTLLLQSGVRELFCVLGNWIGEMENQSW